MLSLSYSAARRVLAAYHLAPTDIQGVFDRLGTVQYDPLAPAGRNVDLVFAARVPGYRVDDWQQAVYGDRVAYDSWDKQACLVPVSDWPQRALVRSRYRPWHDHDILESEPEAVAGVLAEIDCRGPLSSLEFEDRSRAEGGHSWYGQTRVKRILRALWSEGNLITHHRTGGRHYYDRSSRVIPEKYYALPGLEDEDAYHRWAVLRRHQAAGMLRPTAPPEVWCACGPAPVRRRALASAAAAGELIPASVGPSATLYHLHPSLLTLLDAEPPRQVTFLGPLDSLLWDRKAIRDIFGFDYAWEVYKPAHLRRWGYYVLPILYRDSFVARVDSRCSSGVWTMYSWWWEEGVEITDELAEALRTAVKQFLRYLGATELAFGEGVPEDVRSIVAQV